MDGRTAISRLTLSQGITFPRLKNSGQIGRSLLVDAKAGLDMPDSGVSVISEGSVCWQMSGPRSCVATTR